MKQKKKYTTQSRERDDDCISIKVALIGVNWTSRCTAPVLVSPVKVKWLVVIHCLRANCKCSFFLFIYLFFISVDESCFVTNNRRTYEPTFPQTWPTYHTHLWISNIGYKHLSKARKRRFRTKGSKIAYSIIDRNQNV